MASIWSLEETQNSLAAFKLASLLYFPWDLKSCPFRWHDCVQYEALPLCPAGAVREELELSRIQSHTVPPDNCFLFTGHMSWHYYVTMPMPASTLAIAVGCWIEMKPKTSLSDDLMAEHDLPLPPSEADFRFVFGNLLTSLLSLWVISAENLGQFGSHQSRERPTGEKRVGRQKYGLMRREKKTGGWKSSVMPEKHFCVLA